MTAAIREKTRSRVRSSANGKPRSRKPKTVYTAVVQHDGKWWYGWIEEIPGVNSQGRTCK